MIIKNNRNKIAFEVSVRTKRNIEIHTVGASNKDEAMGIIMGRLNIKASNIVEIR